MTTTRNPHPQIRTGFLIEDTWTGIRGRVLECPQDAYGSFTVLTRSGVRKVAGFNARVTSFIQPAVDSVVCVTNGARNFVGRVIEQTPDGEFEMELFGLPGSVAVHPSQMYHVITDISAVAVA